MELKVVRMYEDVELPKYATDGSACIDIVARKCHDSNDRTVIYSTGLKFEIPAGYCMKVYSRSGHGFNKNIRLANCVGIIDSDYRGELMVKLTYDSIDRMDDLSGQRVAQAMLVPIPRINLVEVKSLSDTIRGEGGFGSTN